MGLQIVSEIPMPAIPGRVIAVLSIGHAACNVYWNEETRRVVYSRGTKWYLSPDTNTMDALWDLTGNNLAVESFRLYERGMDITEGGDRDNFKGCDWSDYASDNMCVRATLVPALCNRPRGGSDIMT
jgi:hypothetical protein